MDEREKNTVKGDSKRSLEVIFLQRANKARLHNAQENNPLIQEVQ